jgi:hypothetical protein
MKKLPGLFTLLLLTTLFQGVLAQNKDTALVSVTDFRLDPGTFSWRESNTYYDMTSWDSAPYTEGNLKQKSGGNWLFRMNYRLLLPVGYSSTYKQGYPIIIMLHGAGERGNCWDSDCYCSGCSPNSTPIPGTIPEFLNNDHVLLHGGQEYLKAVNLAGSKKPNDATLNARAFPGFILFPQMENTWGNPEQSNSPVSYAMRILRLVMKEYNVDPDRVYLQGLSLGGQAVYKAMNMCGWLFASATSMSGLNYATQLKYDNVATIPLWVFQGGLDTNPAPSQSETLLNEFCQHGGSARYTFYPDLPHNTWGTAYKEPDFFSWILSKRKNDIHVYYDSTSDSPYKCSYGSSGVKLGLAPGFFAYQWERDGKIIAGANTNQYIARLPGTYRARFSRVSSNPTTEAEWNTWSKPVIIPGDSVVTGPETPPNDAFATEIYPNPASSGDLQLRVVTQDQDPVEINIIDPLSKSVFNATFDPGALQDGIRLPLRSTLANGMYMVVIQQHQRITRQKVLIRN